MEKHQNEGESILDTVLKQVMTEEEIYASSCRKEIWTPHEFAALMSGLTLSRYDAIASGKEKAVSQKDFEKFKAANLVLEKLFCKKVTESKSNILKKGIPMTAWQFIKIAASEQMPFRFGFFKRLPLYLMELCIEFQPENVALRKGPIWRTQYHCALYLKKAEALLEENPNLTASKIYELTTDVRATFQDKIGRQVKYKKRTITESWHRKIQKLPCGRPKKTS